MFPILEEDETYFFFLSMGSLFCKMQPSIIWSPQKRVCTFVSGICLIAINGKWIMVDDRIYSSDTRSQGEFFFGGSPKNLLYIPKDFSREQARNKTRFVPNYVIEFS